MEGTKGAVRGIGVGTRVSLGFEVRDGGDGSRGGRGDTRGLKGLGEE